MELAGGVRR
jgi:hypothetical protein